MANDGFCPKCGAVMYNGVCVSCGYGRSSQPKPEVKDGQSGHYAGNSSSQFGNAERYSGSGSSRFGGAEQYSGGRFSGSAVKDGFADNSSQSRPSGKKLGIGVVIMAWIVICMMVLMIFVGLMFGQVMDTGVQLGIGAVPEPDVSFDDGTVSDWDEWYEQYENGEFDENYSYDEDYTYDEYIPDPSDDYLEAIVSSTVRGLSYDIAWSDTYLYADDENNEAVFYCYYPLVIGSEADYVADINAAIRQTAMSFMPDTLDDNAYGYVDGYVTYMSEEVLSVVILYYYEHAGNEDYHISAMNFDMTTGEQITVREMLPEFEFVTEFRESCEEQNGYSASAVLETMTDDEIMKAIINPETGAAFYSPVGMDIGFNYPDGWMTVTMKFRTY